VNLEETVDHLAEELNLERSEHVREVGRSVAELRD
jgi:predicted transcriptional regulator